MPVGLMRPADRVETTLRFFAEVRGEQRFDGDELGLQRIARRRVDGLGDVATRGPRPGRASPGAARRAPRAPGPTTDTSGPSGIRTRRRPRGPSPEHRSASSCWPRIRWICASVSKTAPVVSRMNCSGLRTSSARLSASSARLQVAEPDADLAERGERDAEPVRRARLLLQLDAALGERQRLLVPVLHHRHVRLVAADRGDARRRRRPSPPGARPARSAAIASSRRPSCARVTPDSEWTIARCRRSPAACSADAACVDVLADDARVADLPVAEAQLVVRRGRSPANRGRARPA